MPEEKLKQSRECINCSNEADIWLDVYDLTGC